MTKTEPAITIASITALIAAVITLGTAFGLNLSEDQQAAILGLVAVAGPIVAGVLTRRQVSPTAPAADHYADTVEQPRHGRDDDGDGRPDLA